MKVNWSCENARSERCDWRCHKRPFPLPPGDFLTYALISQVARICRYDVMKQFDWCVTSPIHAAMLSRRRVCLLYWDVSHWLTGHHAQHT